MAMAFRSPPPLSPRAVRESLHVSRERLARMLDVSAKTVERWEARGAAPASVQVRERLAQLQEIVDLGTQVYTLEGLTQFLNTPLAVFGGRTAVRLIEAGEGERVLAALAADYEGLGS
jgi:transcriptional regulator with XRE-family HTH domain